MSPIANMLIELKNAQMVLKDHVMLPYSEFKFALANLLQEKGFVSNVEKKKRKGRKSDLNYIFIKLKYSDNVGMIKDVKLISKPSRRVYKTKQELGKVLNGFGLSLVSTSSGLMTGEDASKKGVGGELICEIY